MSKKRRVSTSDTTPKPPPPSKKRKSNKNLPSVLPSFVDTAVADGKISEPVSHRTRRSLARARIRELHLRGVAEEIHDTTMTAEVELESFRQRWRKEILQRAGGAEPEPSAQPSDLANSSEPNPGSTAEEMEKESDWRNLPLVLGGGDSSAGGSGGPRALAAMEQGARFSIGESAPFVPASLPSPANQTWMTDDGQGQFAAEVEKSINEGEKPNSATHGLQPLGPKELLDGEEGTDYPYDCDLDLGNAAKTPVPTFDGRPTVNALVDRFIVALAYGWLEKTQARHIMTVIYGVFREQLNAEQLLPDFESLMKDLAEDFPCTPLEVQEGDYALLHRLLILLPQWAMTAFDFQRLTADQVPLFEGQFNLHPLPSARLLVCDRNANGEPLIPLSLALFFEQALRMRGPSVAITPAERAIERLRFEGPKDGEGTRPGILWKPSYHLIEDIYRERQARAQANPQEDEFVEIADPENNMSTEPVKASTLDPEDRNNNTSSKPGSWSIPTDIYSAVNQVLNLVAHHPNKTASEPTASEEPSIQTWASRSEPFLPKFTKFMELPVEIRELIYSFTFGFDYALQPHFCNDTSRGIRFHEDSNFENGGRHNEVYNQLAITRTGKQVRQESLPVFYSANTFCVETNTRMCRETLLYFDNLSRLGRSDMVRRISFTVWFNRSENWSKRILKDIYWALDADKNGETGLCGLTKSACNASEEAGMFLLLRKLSKTFNEDERTITLQTVNTAAFDDYVQLQWFKEVAEGVGLKIKWIQGGRGTGRDYCARVTWIHRLQKKGSTDDKGPESPQKVLKKVFDENSKFVAKHNGRHFYRRNCKGGITWHEEVGRW